jgi:hypothetical protein
MAAALATPDLADGADLGEASSQVGAECTSSVVADWQREAAEVARLVARSARVDQEALDLLASQVENTRRLDRRFGASTLLGAGALVAVRSSLGGRSRPSGDRLTVVLQDLR